MINVKGVGFPACGTPSTVAPGGMICGWLAWIMHPRRPSCGWVRTRPSSKPVCRNSSWCWSLSVPRPSRSQSAPPVAATAATTRLRNSTWNSAG